MIISARRPSGHGVLCGVIAVFLTLLIGDPSGVAGQERDATRALGDMWRGEAPSPSWSGEPAATAYALRSKRHKAFMQGGVPPEYRNARSPYPAAEKLIPEGRALYTVTCMACHGPKGFGDGDAVMDLRPTPVFLAFMIDSPDLIDQYLMWTIAAGGAEFDSSMPAFEGRLTHREIWKIVAYMRAGFPDSQIP